MEGEREDGDDDVQTLMHAEFEIDVDQRYEALALMKFVIDLHFSILSMPKNLSRKMFSFLCNFDLYNKLTIKSSSSIA